MRWDCMVLSFENTLPVSALGRPSLKTSLTLALMGEEFRMQEGRRILWHLPEGLRKI